MRENYLNEGLTKFSKEKGKLFVDFNLDTKGNLDLIRDIESIIKHNWDKFEKKYDTTNTIFKYVDDYVIEFDKENGNFGDEKEDIEFVLDSIKEGILKEKPPVFSLLYPENMSEKEANKMVKKVAKGYKEINGIFFNLNLIKNKKLKEIFSDLSRGKSLIKEEIKKIIDNFEDENLIEVKNGLKKVIQDRLNDKFEINEQKGEEKGLSKEDRKDVMEAAMETAKEIFGDELDKKKIESMVDNAMKKADSVGEAIEIVQNMMDGD